MLKEIKSETICALATPPGIGAIAIIRLSGPGTFSVCNEIFRPHVRKTALLKAKSHTIHYGSIMDGKELVDEVLLSLFRTPHSYTGEDVIEISCHGSPYIQQRILELLLSKEVRLAKPGEFTLRAFLNGKFDLSQAEAVADLIKSRSGASHTLAIQQMRGGFSKKISELRGKLIDLTSLIELELDFSEEEVEFVDRSDLMLLLKAIENEISSLIKSFSLGNVLKHGIPVAIIGKPNVGKSTILNAILNEERAIVSEIPGTTRDTIEDTIVIGGYSFRFIDTAGLRAAENKIESIGIEKTWKKIGEASIILYVFDVREDSFDDVMEALKEFREVTESRTKHLILVGNKTDKLKVLPTGFKQFVEYDTVFVSGKRKENIHLIAETLLKKIGKTEIQGEVIISNTRHFEALKKTLQSIREIYRGIKSNVSTDLLSTDIRKALYHLGEITGEITNDEILSNIFNRFCIGK
ncbi:MAG: tRNA uridine-5-carboxymethylaminomethyl(34) synthesis GTPase MnmE [bacterium]